MRRLSASIAVRPATSRPSGRPAARPHPQVLRVVRQLALAGLAVVLVWPAARGSSAWFGWLPMWLLGMPLVAWWSLLRFPLPRWPRRRQQARRLRRPVPARRAPARMT